MPGRELQYRVVIDTATARRQARNAKQQIERELSSVTGGAGAQRAASSTNTTTKGANAAQRAFEGLNRTVGLFGIALGAAAIVQGGIDLAKLSTEAARAEKAFEQLSGGVAQSEANVQAIQRAAGGTVSSFEAMKIGTQAAALSLAETSEEFARVTRAARAVALVSPVIHDVSNAISELGLASANLSFRRLDQLGLSVSEVRDGMARLRSENEGLDDSQLFLQASVEALERKYSDLLDTTEAQASGFERLSVAMAEARKATAEGGLGQATQASAGFLANSINELNVLFSGATAQAAVLESAIESITTAYKNQSNILENAPVLGDRLKNDRLQIVGQLQEVQQIYKLANEALADDPSLLSYQQNIHQIVAEVARWGTVTDNQLAALRRLYDELDLQRNLNAPNIAAASEAEQATTAAEQRAAKIAEQQAALNAALQKRAIESVDDIGIDAALATLTEQKALVDAAINQLIASGVSNPDEIALRLAEMESQVVGFFDQVEARVNEIDIDFGSIDTGLAQFDAPFIDALPAIDDMRDRLIDLSNELALTGNATADQAAELEYLLNAATAVGGEAVFLTAVTNELGTEFIATNEHAAGLIEQMYLAVAAYLNGSITAEQYAGVTAALGGQLLTLASDAGVATGAINELIAAQGGLAGTSGFQLGQARGNAIGRSIETLNAERERDRQRREAERAAREAAQAQKRAAREAEQAFKKAARETERAFEEAARELESSLRSVPGLFGRSDVTGEQLDKAKAGLPQNFADDFLRRAEDELRNGVDWPEVNFANIAERVGLDPSLPAEMIFNELAAQWESGALFADKSNLELINSEAVKKHMELQERAKRGQQNILEHFGVVIDGAVEAAIVGAGGSVSGGVASIPALSSVAPALASDATGVASGVFTIDSFVIAEEALSGLDTTLMLQASVTDIAVGVDAVNKLDVLSANLAERLKTGIAGAIGTTTWKDGQIVAPVADGLNTAINTQIRGKAESIKSTGASVAGYIMAGATGALAMVDGEGNSTNLISYALLAAINAQFSKNQNMFYAAGQVPAGSVLSGFASAFTTQNADGTQSSTAARAVLDSLTQGIRMNAENFQQRGGTIAVNMQHGFTTQFSNESFKSQVKASGELMGSYLEAGILARVSGGGLADKLATKIMDDMATELESSTQ